MGQANIIKRLCDERFWLLSDFPARSSAMLIDGFAKGISIPSTWGNIAVIAQPLIGVSLDLSTRRTTATGIPQSP